MARKCQPESNKYSHLLASRCHTPGTATLSNRPSPKPWGHLGQPIRKLSEAMHHEPTPTRYPNVCFRDLLWHADEPNCRERETESLESIHGLRMRRKVGILVRNGQVVQCASTRQSRPKHRIDRLCMRDATCLCWIVCLHSLAGKMLQSICLDARHCLHCFTAWSDSQTFAGRLLVVC